MGETVSDEQPTDPQKEPSPNAERQPQPVPPPQQTVTPAAGWYPDAQNPGWRRWWNGSAWTDRRERDAAANPQRPSAPAGPTYCRACGKEVDPRAVVCPSCGVAQGQHPAPFASASPPGMRSGGIAILLSLLWPGAGNLYAEDNSFAIVFMVVSAVNFLLCWTIIWMLVGIPIALVMAIWSAIDSNRKVQQWNVAHGFPAA